MIIHFHFLERRRTVTEKKILKFTLSEEQITLKKILNKDFAHLQVDAISDILPNLNNSAFTFESLEDGKVTCFSKPILGLFKEEAIGQGDFKAHEGDFKIDKELEEIYWANKEIPLGVIRESDNVEVIEKDGLHWLRIDCVLWTKYNYKAVKNVLKSKKKRVSVEIEVLDSEMVSVNGQEIEKIKKFNLLGITILGDKYQEAVPGASLTVLDFIENKLFSEKIACLQFAYQGLDAEKNKGLSVKSDDSEIPLEEGGQKLLTLGQKREVLDAWLHSHLDELPHEKTNDVIDNDENNCCECNSYVWVADLDDVYVYFENEVGTFKAPYTITDVEEGKEVNVNLSEAVRVIRSWEKFVENSPQESEPVLEPIQEPATENFAVEPVNEPIIEEPVNQLAEEPIQEPAIENFAVEPVSEPVIEEPINQEPVVEDFSTHIDNSEPVAQELIANESIDNSIIETVTMEVYNELLQKFNAATEELNTYHEIEAKAQREALATFGCGLIDSETMFDETDVDNVTSMKSTIVSYCENNQLTTQDEVRVFTEDLLAKAVYQKIKKSQTSVVSQPVIPESNVNNDSDLGDAQKEFSVQLPATQKENKKKTPFDKLKEYNAQH